MRKYLLIFFVLFSIETLSLFAQEHTLSDKQKIALETIANRGSTDRITYNRKDGTWSYFNTHVWSALSTHALARKLAARTRHEIIEPLNVLVADLKNAGNTSFAEDLASYHLIRRAYASLSSLYSFYKINPSKINHQDFMYSFAEILKQFREILKNIEEKTGSKNLYQVILLFGGKNDLVVKDKDQGLNYVSMGSEGLAELNRNLKAQGNNRSSIRRAIDFYPEFKRQSLFQSKLKTELKKKKLVMFLVHGTYARHSEEFFSDDNLFFQQAKYAAQALANEFNKPVQVYSYNWSGSGMFGILNLADGFFNNSANDRVLAGRELANVVNTFFPEAEYDDIYIGHSHGGTAIFEFAKTVRNDRTPFMVVTLATPIRKDHITDNLNYLFNFYSNSDRVQQGGSYEISVRKSSATGTHYQSPRRVTRDDIDKLGYFNNNRERFQTVKIYNTEILHNNKGLQGVVDSHSHAKYVISALPRVIDSLVQKDANHTTNYVLNMDLKYRGQITPIFWDTVKFQIGSGDY